MESKITEKHERVIIVQKSAPEQLQQLQEKSDLEQLETSIGFTKVFRKISESVIIISMKHVMIRKKIAH